MPLRFYTRQDFEEIDRAQTIHDLLLVASRVLVRMARAHPRSRIGIVCGPINTGGMGSRDENLAVFRRHIAELMERGAVIFSQMPFENAIARIVPPETYHQNPYYLLKGFYLPIFEEGTITDMYFIPGWDGSVGARWEYAQGERLKRRIIHLPHLPLI